MKKILWKNSDISKLCRGRCKSHGRYQIYVLKMKCTLQKFAFRGQKSGHFWSPRQTFWPQNDTLSTRKRKKHECKNGHFWSFLVIFGGQNVTKIYIKIYIFSSCGRNCTKKKKCAKCRARHFCKMSILTKVGDKIWAKMAIFFNKMSYKF